jgi:hypothetical protein
MYAKVSALSSNLEFNITVGSEESILLVPNLAINGLDGDVLQLDQWLKTRFFSLTSATDIEFTKALPDITIIVCLEAIL